MQLYNCKLVWKSCYIISSHLVWARLRSIKRGKKLLLYTYGARLVQFGQNAWSLSSEFVLWNWSIHIHAVLAMLVDNSFITVHISWFQLLRNIIAIGCWIEIMFQPGAVFMVTDIMCSLTTAEQELCCSTMYIPWSYTPSQNLLFCQPYCVNKCCQGRFKLVTGVNATQRNNKYYFFVMKWGLIDVITGR